MILTAYVTEDALKSILLLHLYNAQYTILTYIIYHCEILDSMK